jgi:hypothetical protein
MNTRRLKFRMMVSSTQESTTDAVLTLQNCGQVNDQETLTVTSMATSTTMAMAGWGGDGMISNAQPPAALGVLQTWTLPCTPPPDTAHSKDPSLALLTKVLH